jgi:hypothetical protein
MEYQDVASQYYYDHLKVQLANASYDLNSYFASSMSSHIGVARCNDTRYVASADSFDNAFIIHIIIMDIAVKSRCQL